MNSPTRQQLRQQFTRFLFTGGIAALANFGSRFLFSEFVDFESAVLLAFLVGLTVGFVLSRRYVFDSSDNSLATEISWYLAVNLVALLQTWLVSIYGAHWLEPVIGLAPAQAIAHMTGIILPVFTSYLGHKYFTFRRREINDEQ